MTSFPYKKCQLFAKILAENGFFEMMEDGSIEVPEVQINTAHETKWAGYKRQERALDNVQRYRDRKEKEGEIEGEKREKRTISKNSFNNFQQRNDYNFEEFERLSQEEKNDQQEIKDLLETSAHQIDREGSVNQLVDRLRSSKFEE